MDCCRAVLAASKDVPTHLLTTFVASTFFGMCILLYVIVFLVAPVPQSPMPQEKTFRHIEPDGRTSSRKQLPCWLDKFNAGKQAAKEGEKPVKPRIEDAEVFLSVVVPAYNEEKRIGSMLADAVKFLEQSPFADSRKDRSATKEPNGVPKFEKSKSGWEILVVSDGSTDATAATALNFAAKLSRPSASSIRVVELSRNRGKGAAVTHGLRHARGTYAMFADADGASRFSDTSSLLANCRAIEDIHGRGVAVGSRAHLVGSDMVVKRSWLRIFLMHSFHLFLWFCTTPATSRIRDTQCGFKLFSRESLRDIVPYMHNEGWIFDVEMLMLAESAGIAVAEVPIGWKEIKGSKLNVVWDSIGMAWGLAILRAAWATGVYKRN